MVSGRLPPLRRVLVVCAHPDDESFGLGAILAALAGGGAQVTVLADGRALVTGGVGSFGPGAPLLRAAEVFDPRTNGWVKTSPMQSARLTHSAVLLADGRVLVAGCGAGESVARAEVWSPSDGRWTVAGNVQAENPMGRLFAFGDGSAMFVPVREPIELWLPRKP